MHFVNLALMCISIIWGFRFQWNCKRKSILILNVQFWSRKIEIVFSCILQFFFYLQKIIIIIFFFTMCSRPNILIGTWQASTSNLQFTSIFWLLFWKGIATQLLGIFLYAINALPVYYAAFFAIMDSNVANSLILIHVLKNNTRESDEWQNVGHESLTNVGHNFSFFF